MCALSHTHTPSVCKQQTPQLCKHRAPQFLQPLWVPLQTFQPVSNQVNLTATQPAKLNKVNESLSDFDLPFTSPAGFSWDPHNNSPVRQAGSDQLESPHAFPQGRVA